MAVSQKDQSAIAQVEGFLSYIHEPGAVGLVQQSYREMDEYERETAFFYALGQLLEATAVAKALTYLKGQE